MLQTTAKLRKAEEIATAYLSGKITKEQAIVGFQILRGLAEPTEPLFRYFEEYGTPEPITWLLKDYIPLKGVCVIGGSAGSGKSFISEEIISAILNKRKLFNHFEIGHEKPIILIDMENDHSTLYDRLMKMGGIPAKKLLLFTFAENFDILGDAYVSELRELIKKTDPCLVVFDTLRRTYSGDENDSRIINAIYKTVLAPISKDRCCMIIAHKRKGFKTKTSEDELDEIRGTGDIVGLASSVLMVKKNIDDTITITPKKLRPAKLASPFTVKIINKNNKIHFEFLEQEANLATEIDILADKLLSWLQRNKKPHDIIKTKEMVEAMEEEGHKRRNISNAIAILRGKDILLHEKRGYYKFIWGQDDLLNF